MNILVRKLADWIGDWAGEEIVGGLKIREAAEVHVRFTEAMEQARVGNKCLFGAKLDLKNVLRFGGAFAGNQVLGAPGSTTASGTLFVRLLPVAAKMMGRV